MPAAPGAPQFQPLTFPEDFALTIDLEGETITAPVPKDSDGNREWRTRVRDKARDDLDTQRSLLGLCAAGAEGCIYWINAFVWTFRQKRVDEHGIEKSILGGDTDVRFVTWPVQDEAVRAIFDAIENGGDIAIDKSRDMGASWLTLVVFVWFWIFREGVNFRILSRVEELVDTADDPDSMFWKIDFVLRTLPPWMVPPHRRTYKKLVNRRPGNNTIIGRSTTGAQGRAGRCTAAVFDEFALVREARTIWQGFQQTTACRIAVSSAYGPVFFSKLVRSPQVRVIRLAWWDHPEKGAGRYTRKDPTTGKIEIRSPYYDKLEDKVRDKRALAEEMGMDHSGAGLTFFDDGELARHRAMHARDPLYLGHLVYTGTLDRDAALVRARGDCFHFAGESGEGPWKLWCELFDDGTGVWRPDQRHTYVIGCDISFGTGASNSTGFVMNLETGEQVGGFASAEYGPEEFARQMAAAGLWFGGPRGCAFVGWEANGAGGLFGRTLVRSLRYPWRFYTLKDDEDTPKRGRAFGWHSNQQRKKDVLGIFRGAIARDEVEVRDEDVLDEASSYMFFDSGEIGPGELKEESPVAMATHGDRVIGGAVAVYVSKFAHRCNPPDPKPPNGSPAWVMQQVRKKKRAARARA